MCVIFLYFSFFQCFSTLLLIRWIIKLTVALVVFLHSTFHYYLCVLFMFIFFSNQLGMPPSWLRRVGMCFVAHRLIFCMLILISQIYFMVSEAFIKSNSFPAFTRHKTGSVRITILHNLRFLFFCSKAMIMFLAFLHSVEDPTHNNRYIKTVFNVIFLTLD